MRKIKFRGISKKINDWVYGSYWQDCRIGPTIIYGDGSSRDDFHLVDEETVGQLTDIKDENGVEIYEGDVVKVKYINVLGDLNTFITSIKYANCGFEFGKFLPAEHEDSCLELRDTEFDSIQVIGNIYETPELLEK